jgi:2-polyprenyl-3-methyl-5-hydroxy-6-metoxy-1,4-benzoquinol methylase
VTNWTNDTVIQRWGAMPRAVLESMEPDGDFAKRHLLNPVLLRMLGDLRGRRVLDAGCGHGYLSRMLASHGARVTAVEPGQSLFAYAAEKETQRQQGIRYLQADLCQLPDLGSPFHAVVASMVLMAIPAWAAAMKACTDALAPDGVFVFSVTHPCFEQLAPSWRKHGESAHASTSPNTRSPDPMRPTSTAPSRPTSTNWPASAASYVKSPSPA